MKFLVWAILDSPGPALFIIKSARHLNPQLRIITRVTYISELTKIQDLDVEYVCAEEETVKAFISKTTELFDNQVN